MFSIFKSKRLLCQSVPQRAWCWLAGFRILLQSQSPDVEFFGPLKSLRSKDEQTWRNKHNGETVDRVAKIGAAGQAMVQALFTYQRIMKGAKNVGVFHINRKILLDDPSIRDEDAIVATKSREMVAKF